MKLSIVLAILALLFLALSASAQTSTSSKAIAPSILEHRMNRDMKPLNLEVVLERKIQIENSIVTRKKLVYFIESDPAHIKNDFDLSGGKPNLHRC